MTKLTIKQLDRIKVVADKLGVETFVIETASNGIGSTLTLSYETFMEDWPATIIVNLTDIGEW
jgi:hypothetical protein